MENKYNINITKKAEKFIQKQDKNIQKRIVKAILELPNGDIKKLKGIDDIYRLRVGEFRILFEKNDNIFIGTIDMYILFVEPIFLCINFNTINSERISTTIVNFELSIVN